MLKGKDLQSPEQRDLGAWQLPCWEQEALQVCAPGGWSFNWAALAVCVWGTDLVKGLRPRFSMFTFPCKLLNFVEQKQNMSHKCKLHM